MLNQKSQIPTFIPLPDAARKFSLTEQVLTQLVETGKIEAVKLPSGELLVPANNDNQPKTKKDIINKKFAHLCGQWITVSQASKKYGVPGTTIREWIALKYIQTTDDAYPMKLNEAEMAYCAEIHHNRKAAGTRSGVPLLNKNGLPYKLKHPKLAEYRRKKKQKNGDRI